MTAALRVDPENLDPPYEQLRRQVAEHVAAGRLAEGSRLPPVRQLAGDLGLAAGTVARAYRELEGAGIVRTRRGGGTTIAPGARLLAGARARSPGDPPLEAHLRAAVDGALRAGWSPAQVRSVVDGALGRVAGRADDG